MYEQAFSLRCRASPDLDLTIPAAFAGNLLLCLLSMKVGSTLKVTGERGRKLFPDGATADWMCRQTEAVLQRMKSWAPVPLSSYCQNRNSDRIAWLWALPPNRPPPKKKERKEKGPGQQKMKQRKMMSGVGRTKAELAIEQSHMKETRHHTVSHNVQ
jgi:hypothetical protein